MKKAAQGKAYENRIRRMARRQGMSLVKNRRRDPQSLDFGGYMLINVNGNYIVAGGNWDFALFDAEAFLLG